jgi:hypothetical protein
MTSRTRPAGPRPISPAALLDAGRPTRRRLVIPASGDEGKRLAEAVDAARETLQMTRLAVQLAPKDSDQAQQATDRQPQLQKALDDAEAAFEAAAKVVDLQPVAKTEMDALRAAHPPTDAQIAEAEKSAQSKPLWDEEFEYELIARTIVTDPPMTGADVHLLEDQWSAGDWAALENFVQEVNSQSRLRLLGN